MWAATYRDAGFYCAIAISIAALFPFVQFFRRRLNPKNRTYRVEGIPVGWSQRVLRDFLADHFKAKDKVDVEVFSLSPILKNARGRYGVATVKFKKAPSKLQQLQNSGTYSIAQHSLTLDCGFLDLTVLHTPPREEDHKVDIVIVPGLGGHAFGSFTARRGEDMWPRDALPLELAEENNNVARIMTYGYESNLLDKYSSQNIGDIADRFASSLKVLLGQGDAEAKPIIFIGHSMGGLVIKKALIGLSESIDDQDAARVFRAARGIAFFGVPHFGMKIDSVLPLVGRGANAPMIHSLSSDNSQFLRDLAPRFDKLLDNLVSYQIACVHFYETEMSPTAKMNIFGWWSNKGDRQLLLSSFSAAPPRKGDISLAIKRTHSDMVKFLGRQDNEWKKVAPLLTKLVARVQKTVQDALDKELEEKYKNAKEVCQASLKVREENINNRSHKLEEDRLAGTCEWLFLDDAYVKWKDTRNQDPSSILLLEGKPGSGKSVLMRAAVEDCAQAGSITLSFFFDGRAGSVEQDQSALGMYKALLLQLLLSLARPELIDLMPAVLQHRDKSGSWSATEVWAVMAIVLERLKCNQLFVIIDALDECADGNLPSLLGFVEAMAQGRCVRPCLSSRTSAPFYVFEGRLDIATVDVALRNKGDINKLIAIRLKELQLHTTRPLVFEQMESILSSRASGVILWAELVIQHIGKQVLSSARADHELIGDIEHLDGKLTSLYRHLMGKIAPSDRVQTCALMLLIQVSKRPLSPDEIRSMLECAVQKPGSLKSVDITKRIQSLSSGLLECHQRSGYKSKTQTIVVQHMHKSVGDFLLHDAGLSILDDRFKAGNVEAQYHYAALGLCLGTFNCKLETDCDDAELPFLSYAALFWTMHARQGEAGLDGDHNWSLPDFLDDCGSFDAQRVARLFQDHDNWRDYITFAGEDVPSTSELYGKTSILLFLAFAGCTKLVTRHLTKCPSCQSPTFNRTRNLHQAFFLASCCGWHGTAEAILDHPASLNAGGVDIDALPDNGAVSEDDDYGGPITALYSSCVSGHVDVVDFLLRRGADPLKRVRQGYELPLHAAAANKNPNLVKVLLRHCRSPDRTLMAALLSSQTTTGFNAFHWAVVQGRSTALDLLLQEAARVPDDGVLVKALTQGDEGGNTAYDWATMYWDHLEDGGSIDTDADAKSLKHAIARFESLLRANNLGINIQDASG